MATLSTAQSQWKQFFDRQPKPITNDGNATARPTHLNTVNSRQNTWWGDEIGDKPSDTTRVYALNLNGMTLDKQGGQFDIHCRELKDIKVDVFCGQEHNLDTSQPSIRAILYHTASQHWERSKLTMATTPIPFTSSFKPGGTLILTAGSVTSRVIKQERDKWGRWTCQIFQGTKARNLAILSAYQPIFNGSSTGKITVAAQQVSLLMRAGDPTGHPRVAFRRDLLQCIRDYRKLGMDILLIGDFNETLGSDPDGMSKVAEECGLIDLMSSRHSSVHPATYARGTKRLDYALASPHVVSSLTKSGYEEFNGRFPSDHRGYYFDFNTDALFGSPTQDLANRVNRGLSSRNTAHVTAYIRRKHDLLAQCGAFDRGRRLERPGNRHVLADRLDNDVLLASLTAEKSLPQLDEPAWSLDLAEARRVVNLLSRHLSFLRTGRDHSQTFHREFQRLRQPLILPETKSTCSLALREAKKMVSDLVRDSVERRDEERNRKIKSLELAGDAADKTHAQYLRKIKKAEDIKNLFRKLKYVRKKQDRTGVTRVEIPRQDGADPKTCIDWVQIDVPSDVLRHLQQRNRTHFGQASGTPFTIPPLMTDLGFDGDGPGGQMILDGQYDCQALEPSVQRLIHHMKFVHDLAHDATPSTISALAFEQKLRIWSESTTTSPSGLHLGHYKALIARHSFISDAHDEDLTDDFKRQREELNTKQKDLFDLHLQLINYALTRGFSYKRWQTIANTILFKDTNNVRIHRTRVIHIYEADFNLTLGIKWREAMHYAEDTNKLNPGQYGSRSNRNAVDPVFIEELQLEISRATRKPVLLTNYDAMACYDRIIPNVGMLVSRKYGVQRNVTKTNAVTLERAEYRIRTELGLAPTGYRHEEAYPIYGTGQGSANSPAIWCFLSSALFDCYDDIAHEAAYCDPTYNVNVSLGMIGFVDDCNGQTNQFLANGSAATVHQLVTQTCHNAQEWTNLLAASGGALELSKCSCHIVQWQFTTGGAPVVVPRHPEMQCKLQVQDPSTGASHRLHLLSAYEAHKTLGHYKEPAGTQVMQYQQLKRKSDESTAFLWKCPLNRLESWTYYYACYLPSIGYPLSCTFFTKPQLDKVQRKAMQIIVPRCGFNRHTKKAILYGPLELGGASFRHLYTEQGVGQINLFLSHWRKQSTAGKLLKIAVAWFQLQSGVSYSILAKVDTHLPHLESKWLASLRVFLESTSMSLHVDVPGIPARQRVRDHYIMDMVLSANFTNAEVRKINYCRLYLAAVTLADVTKLNGRDLDMSKLEGRPSLRSSATMEAVIHQERPSAESWKLWKRANLLWSSPDGTLHESLGPWIVSIRQQRQQHPAYWQHDERCPGDTILWVKVGDDYLCCVHDQQGWIYRESGISRAWDDLPSDVTPVDAWPSQPGYWRVEYAAGMGTKFMTRRPHFSATFSDFLDHLPEWECDLLKHVEMLEDPFSISWELSHGLRAVSDGSVCDGNQGAFGWIISTANGIRLSKGMGPARGAKVDSYRAEAYGMLTVLTFLRRLSDFTKQDVLWFGVLATDSQSLLDAIADRTQQTPETPPTYGPIKQLHHLDARCPEWDLLSSIVVELSRWPDIALEYVAAHQDRRTAYENLCLLAQLNVDADDMATQYQTEMGDSRPFAYLTSTAGVHLQTPKGTCTANYATTIRHLATYSDLWDHLQAKNQWKPTTMKSINWKAHGTVLRKRIQHRTHLVKLVQGILPTCKHVHRKDPVRSLCPLCRSATEDWDHILKCRHASRQTWRTKMLLEVEKVCKSNGTRPALQRLLLAALRQWLDADGDITVDPTSYPPDVQRLIYRQNLIGWRHLFLGRFSTEWAHLQDTQYAARQRDPKKIKRTGDRWQVIMIGVLWDEWWKVWKSRNQDLHGADAAQRARAETRETHRDLRDLYDQRERVDPHVRTIFQHELADQLAQPTWYNKNWVAIHGPLIRENLKQVALRAKAGVRSIRQYMVPVER